MILKGRSVQESSAVFWEIFLEIIVNFMQNSGNAILIKANKY